MFRQARFQDKIIYYYIKGSGPVVLLLHGFLLSSEIWGNFAEGLAKNNTVIAIDLPGHGRSASFPPVHSMELMARAAIAVLEQESCEKASLIGHSMGGYVALALLESYADYFSHMVLLNTYPYADTKEKSVAREKLIHLIRKGKKKLFLTEAMRALLPESFIIGNKELEKLRRNFSNDFTDESIIATTIGLKERKDRTMLLKKPPIPLLWLIGSVDDQNNYSEILERTAIQEILLPEIVPLGHMSFLEDPQSLLQYCQGFFSN